MADDRLFVYGTLREHQTAHALVAPNIARRAAATMEGILYAFPEGYPGMVPGAGVVCGEVVWLTEVAATLQRLDAYEGNEFARVMCQVVLNSGRHLSAWIYTLADPDLATRAELVESGDWVAYLERSELR